MKPSQVEPIEDATEEPLSVEEDDLAWHKGVYKRVADVEEGRDKVDEEAEKGPLEKERQEKEVSPFPCPTPFTKPDKGSLYGENT